MPYYGVKNGHNKGVYSTWDECKQQTNGFKGAVFKKFNTFEEADEFVSGSKVIITNNLELDKIIYVDGGFNKRTGDSAWASVVNGYSNDLIPHAYHYGLLENMEIKEVDLPKGKRWIIISKFDGVYHQNNGAELLALVVGLRLAIFITKNLSFVKTVFSDSQVVLYWSIRLKDESAATFCPRKVAYINELINLRKEYESLGGTVEKVDGGSNPADLGYH